MNELMVIHEYEDGSVTVCDPWGETGYLTKEEYEVYLKNRENLEKENSHKTVEMCKYFDCHQGRNFCTNKKVLSNKCKGVCEHHEI